MFSCSNGEGAFKFGILKSEKLFNVALGAGVPDEELDVHVLKFVDA